MNFLKIAEERYTSKKYDSSKKISPEVIDELKKIIRLCPSSINSQPWYFTFVSDTKTKNALAKVSFFNSPKIIAASHLVVFGAISSVKEFEKQIEATLPSGAVGYYNTFLKSKGEEAIKKWFSQQVYLAVGFFLSACAVMGIDATPMEGIEPEKYDSILKNSRHNTLVAIAIGYRDVNDTNQPAVKPKSRLPEEVVVRTI